MLRFEFSDEIIAKLASSWNCMYSSLWVN